MSYKYADLFLQDSVKKELNIVFDNGTITNAELHSNQFELNESICSENELRFGCCEASSVKFKVSNVFESLNGKQIDISMILNGHSDEPFKFGKYKVVSDTPTADRNFRDIVAYDKMYDIINSDVAEWYNGLTFPLTMKEFRTSFVSHFGMEEVEITLVNDDMIIEKTVETVELSGKDVVRAICELNGCFGHINRENKFEYIFLSSVTEIYPDNDLYPSNELYPSESNDVTNVSKSHYISCQYEDFKTQYIDALEIRPEEDSAGSVVGDSKGNVYIIYGNFLLYGKTTDELTEIVEKLIPVIEIVQYRPANVSAIGNPTISVGDGIRLNTKYEIINTYVLQRKITGIQSLKDSYISTGVEKYTGNVNSVKADIVKLKAKTNKLTRTAEETKLEMEDLENGLRSEFTQTASELKIEIQKNINDVENKVNEMDISINQAITDQSTSIRSDTEKIILSALESYVTTGDYETYKQTVQTQLAIMADEIKLTFSSASSQIEDVNSEVQSKFNELYKHITFSGENGIEIHDGINTLSLVMDTDGISFKKNGEQFGFWDGNDFYTGNIIVEVNERAQFGNYAFVPRSDGSLMFLKVGG